MNGSRCSILCKFRSGWIRLLSISSSLHLVISHLITIVRMEYGRRNDDEIANSVFISVSAASIYNDESTDIFFYAAIAANKQFRSGYGNSTVIRELSGRLRSLLLSNGFLSIPLFLFHLPLNHTIKRNALAEKSSAIFINEMGHVTPRYDTTLSIQGKIPWLPFNHIAKWTNNHKKASMLQIWRVNHWFYFHRFRFRRNRFYREKSKFERVIPVIHSVNLVQTKTKIKIDSRFRWQVKMHCFFVDDTNISKTSDWRFTLSTWSKLDQFAEWKLITN